MKYELKNWGAGVPDKDRRKSVILITLLFILLGLFILHFFFFMKISHRVIVSLPISDLIISLAFSGFMALIFSFRRKQLINKSLKKRIDQYCHRFFCIACSCFIITAPLFDYYVYLYPKETHTYLTDYEITIPGPRTARFSRCDKGIKIQDHYTSQRFFLCFNDKKYSDYNSQALVTVQSNILGSYLVNYDISPKNTD